MNPYIKRLNDDTEVVAFLLSLNGDTSPSVESIPFCIAAALHALVLSNKNVAM